MKSIATLLFIFLFTFSLTAQWTELNSGTTDWLRGVWFITPSEGIVVGYNGRIMKTYNGGETWTTKDSGTTRNLFSIFFADENTGFATGAGGTILKTTTGGETWLKIQEGGPTLHESYFLSPQIGYIAGEGGRVQKTTDGGASYTILELGSFNGKVSTFFNDEDTGYFVGVGSAESVQKTTDGGASFLGMYVSGFAEFGSVYFTDFNTGYVTSIGAPKIIKTTDGGFTWEEKSFSFNGGIYGIKFSDDNNGLAIGGFPSGSIIVGTSDSGDSWQQETTLNNNPLFDVFMVSENYAFAVGSEGTILRKGQRLVATQEPVISKLKIYPNPAQDYVSIQNERTPNAKYTFTIMDSRGIVVETGFSTHVESININSLSAGLYFLNISTPEGNATLKFIKE